MAALQAARMGVSVCLLSPNGRIGGLTTAGLSGTDVGQDEAIGGLARRFYVEMGMLYGRKEPQWFFEPKVALRILEDWLRDADLSPWFDAVLERVEVREGRIQSIILRDGREVQADQFIDSTYEGDLMAMAGVEYVVGREANARYRETLSGIQFGHPYHNFQTWVDPFVIPGKPDSGLLPEVEESVPGVQGQEDRRVQAYTFRLCLSCDPSNRQPWSAPEGYDPGRYELLSRYVNSGFWDFCPTPFLPNQKTDLNNYGAFSTDYIGGSHAWPEADPETRKRLMDEHRRYQQGLLYYMATDDHLPAELRKQVNEWGLTMDEFPETGGWSPELYVREGRRMRGMDTVTEAHARSLLRTDQPVALASYTMDSHHCRRMVMDGRVLNEGDVQVNLPRPFGIPFGSMVPAREQVGNLLVTCALSASHITYGSIRMEPVFMALGQAAGLAAVQASRQQTAQQDLPYAPLREALVAEGQVVDAPAASGWFRSNGA